MRIAGGTTGTQTLSETGDSSKPISVYQSIEDGTVQYGLKLNNNDVFGDIFGAKIKLTLNINVGTQGLGINVIQGTGKDTIDYGIRVNNTGSVGIYAGSAVWDSDLKTSTRDFAGIEVDAFLALAVVGVAAGIPYIKGSPSQTVPAF